VPTSTGRSLQGDEGQGTRSAQLAVDGPQTAEAAGFDAVQEQMKDGSSALAKSLEQP